MLDNDWGGFVGSTAIGNGPWVMTNPERLIGMSPRGSGQCVAIAQSTLVMPHTSWWREGAVVLGTSGITRGTVIATFINGRYRSLKHGNHVAIYIGQGEGFIRVVEQWTGQPPQVRDIGLKPGMTDRSNNARAFSVVYTLPAAPHVPHHARTRRHRRRR